MNDRRAFTLLELLATTAIIGVLAAFLFPLTGTMLDNARGAKCMQNLRQLYTGIRLYAADNNNKIPAAGGDPWHYQTKEYLESKENMSKVYVCPLDKNPASGVLTYDINSNLLGKSFAVLPGKTLLLTESSNIYNINGNAAQVNALLYNHAKRKAVNVLYVDGSSELRYSVPDSTSDPTLWKPSS